MTEIALSPSSPEEFLFSTRSEEISRLLFKAFLLSLAASDSEREMVFCKVADNNDY
jgi:hypothetical protein